MAFTRRTTHVAPATAETIAAAAACLRAGGLVAMPTETVYGLAADATSDAAVAGIYAAKGRPTFNPLIAHVLDVAAARREGAFSREAEKLAEAFWPGPLTLVAPAAPSCRVSLLARAGLDTLAIRVPAHETARALIEAARTPLVAPSANRSGRVSPTTAAACSGRSRRAGSTGFSTAGLRATGSNRRSSRVSLPGPTLLRPGAIAREAIEGVLQAPLAVRDESEKGAQCARATRIALCAARPASARGRRRGERRSRARFCRRAGGQRGGRASRSVALRRPRRGRIESLRLSARSGRNRRAAHSRRSRSPPRPRRRDQRQAQTRGRAQNAPRLRDILDFDARNCRIAAMSDKMTIDGLQPATKA